MNLVTYKMYGRTNQVLINILLGGLSFNRIFASVSVFSFVTLQFSGFVDDQENCDDLPSRYVTLICTHKFTLSPTHLH